MLFLPTSFIIYISGTDRHVISYHTRDTAMCSKIDLGRHSDNIHVNDKHKTTSGREQRSGIKEAISVHES